MSCLTFWKDALRTSWSWWTPSSIFLLVIMNPIWFFALSMYLSLSILWECFGNVLGLFWECFGTITDSKNWEWRDFLGMLGLKWECFGTILGMSKKVGFFVFFGGGFE